MEVRIQVDTRAVEAALRRAPHAISSAMEAAMEDATADIHKQMFTYPTQRAGSTYKRTNTLRSSWTRRMRREGAVVIGEVVSSGAIAPYNQRVQSAQHQAAVHRGVWTNTDREVVERSRQRIAGYFRTRLRRAAQEIAR